ncbi:MAG: hypothetical protein ABGX27_07145 [Desulfurobacteriaceae bacterium]
MGVYKKASALILILFCSSAFSAERPLWIDNPFLGGVIGSIGWAEPKYEEDEQVEIAKLRALSELAFQFKVYVKSICEKRVKKALSGNYSKKFSCDSLLRGEYYFLPEETEVKDKWKDPKSGILYIWLVVKPQILKTFEINQKQGEKK